MTKAENPIRVYFAILNKGWLRSEMAYSVIPKMQNTKGVELVWENPNISWGEPICSNRACIVNRFLKTDCDYLLMIDDDVIPMHNPLELVYADEDIIGSPAKVRQNPQELNWTAYVKAKDKDKDGYYPTDFGTVSSDADLLKVDIVGTGCILIKRRVLEKLKAPFLVEFREDGTNKYGTDFAFCRRAAKAGFGIYTTPQRLCEHIKEVGLLDMTAYDDSDYRDTSPSKYGIPWGGMAITQKDWKFIKDAIEKYEVKHVLEFGAGLSSLLMAEHAIVDSFECSKEQAELITSKENGKVFVIIWDGKDCTLPRSHYDMAFVDGPLGKVCGGIGRQHSIRIASENADIVIVHDAGRIDEQRWQNEYLRPDFNMVAKNGTHQSRCQLWTRKGK